MDFGYLVNLFKSALLTPEKLWSQESAKNYTFQELLKFPATPTIVIVATISSMLILIFGYKVPFVPVAVHTSLSDIIIGFIGTVVMFLITVTLFGWLSGYIASLFGGKNDFSRGVLMIFLVSIPSLIGRAVSPLPYIGAIVSIGLGIYSLILLYKAPFFFLDLPEENKTKNFILFLIAAFVVSVILGVTLGSLFQPSLPAVTTAA
jgi:hypothetical protein